MKLLPIIILIFCVAKSSLAQDVNTTLGIPRVVDLNTITGETPNNIGSTVYNTTDNLIYTYDGTNWIPATDDQNAEEVPLVNNVDLNTSTTDPTTAQILETNVEQAIQAIAPITSKAARVFYPPSIEIDVSAITQPGDPDETIDLHQQYVNQYDLSLNSTVINGNTVNYQTAASAGAPLNIPLYTASELYYYVTFADASVFNITGISNTGILSYRVIGQPRDFNTLINVVFVVK